jgi:NADPH:quinone reductase-like Zn-dependent oxidoreductase
MSPSTAWTFQKQDNAYELVQIDRPIPQAGSLGDYDVLVQIKAVSLNYRDLIAWRNMAGRQLDGRVPASDGAGEVIAVGKKVTLWKPGDRLVGCFFPLWQAEPFDLIHHKNDLGGTLDGMLQSYRVLPETGWVRIPDYLDFEQAATLPCAALTAWYALVARGGLRTGQSVLALGTGGVSIFALQIAKAFGARVYITSGDDAKLERAKSVGADYCVNYKTTPDWAGAIWQATNDRGVDHVVEVGGPGTLEQSMRAVAAGGQIALIGVLTGFGAPASSLFPLLARNVRLNGIYVGPRSEFLRMNEFFQTHQIAPIIDQKFSMDRAPEAFRYLASGHHFGKVVIQVE